MAKVYCPFPGCDFAVTPRRGDKVAYGTGSDIVNQHVARAHKGRSLREVELVNVRRRRSR